MTGSEQQPQPSSVAGEAAVTDWVRFLNDRVVEEREAAETVGAAGWWEVSDAGAQRFGVQAAGRVFAPVLTGRGHWDDLEAALHIVRNQPGRTQDDLVGKQMLLRLLEESARSNNPLTEALLQVVRQFAAPFQDHPDHPEYTPEGAS